MATSRWRSSLANAETRLRRSLGIAGPIDLELEAAPKLTPIVITDDATRPGASSQLRGRRWRAWANGNNAAATRSSDWLFADPPYGPSGSLADPYAGGIIVDHCEISFTATTVARLLFTFFQFPTPLVINPGIPVLVTPVNGYFVDPLRTGSEVAPVFCGHFPAVTPETGGGPQMSKYYFGITQPGGGPIRIDLNMMLNWNSALSFGMDPASPAAPAGGYDIAINYFGRIF